MKKIEYLTLNDRAYGEIKKGLIAGTFAPDQSLVIRTLAEMYGISTTPVREALQRLVAERLLVMLPNRSIAVPPLSAEKFIELARIRAALEGLAGELATANLRPAQIERLKTLFEDIEKTTRAKNMKSYVALNQKFHFAIYEKAESPHLLQMIQDLWSQVGPFFNRLFEDENFLAHANEQHANILAALAAGDGKAVRGSIVKDIEVAADALLPRLSFLGGKRRL